MSRCFAFEPSDNPAPDAKESKGLELVPNEGQLSHYLSSMINAFANDMIIAFGALVFLISK